MAFAEFLLYNAVPFLQICTVVYIFQSVVTFDDWLKCCWKHKLLRCLFHSIVYWFSFCSKFKKIVSFLRCILQLVILEMVLAIFGHNLRKFFNILEKILHRIPPRLVKKPSISETFTDQDILATIKVINNDIDSIILLPSNLSGSNYYDDIQSKNLHFTTCKTYVTDDDIELMVVSVYYTWRYNYLMPVINFVEAFKFITPFAEETVKEVKAGLIADNVLYYLYVKQTNNETSLRLYKGDNFFKLNRLSGQWPNLLDVVFSIAVYETFLFVVCWLTDDKNFVLIRIPEVNGKWSSADKEYQIHYCYKILNKSFGHMFSNYLCYNSYDGFMAIDLLNGTLQYLSYSRNFGPQQYFQIRQITDGDESQFELCRNRISSDSLLCLSMKVLYDYHGWYLKILCVSCLSDLGIPEAVVREYCSLPNLIINRLLCKLITNVFLLSFLCTVWISLFVHYLR